MPFEAPKNSEVILATSPERRETNGSQETGLQPLRPAASIVANQKI